jgi:transcriptional repressor NrdR
MGHVIKKDNRQEEFNPNKIRSSIRKASINLGELPKDLFHNTKKIADSIVKKFESNEIVETNLIRRSILKDLEKCEPQVAESWKKFDAKYKF